jgi:type IV secretory pathway VirB2 component (pilin)
MLLKFNFLDLKANADLAFRVLVFFCITLIILSTSNEVFATTSSDADVFGTTLCGVVGALKGNVAKAIATAAIFATALGFFSGKLQWQTVAVLSVGIITIFSAGTLVGWLSGSAGSGCS